MKTAQTLLRSGSVVAGLTLVSRVLGFVRDQVLAVVFGASAQTDAFLVAFKIPNFLRRLFAEGAFSQAFVPVFTEYRETREPAALRELAAHVSGTLAGILLLVTTFAMIASPAVIYLFAPGFADSPTQFDLATDLLRITFPYLLFVSLLAYAASMQHAFGYFALPALAPALLNISMIAAALLLAPHLDTPIVALAIGVFVAGVLQLALQFPLLRRLGLLPRPRWGLRHPGVRRILKLMAPAVFGSSVAQINLLLDTIIASFLAVGSLSWLYYSDRLMEFPLGLLGVTLGTVILPRLSREHARAGTEAFRATIDWALRLALLFAVPSAIGLAMLAVPILQTLFQYGAFRPEDTAMASYSLYAYAFGLPAFVLIKIFAPAFFSRQDTRTPVRIGVIALVTNMALNLLLVLPMLWLGFVAPHTGLALATSLAAWQQATLLYFALARADIYAIPPELLAFARRLLPAFAALLAVLVLLAPGDGSALDAADRVLRLAGIIAAAAGAFAVALWLCGIRPRHIASP